MKTFEIKPVETLEEAVEQGGKLLDELRPGWENTVRGAMTEGLFAMNRWDSCMAGTLEVYRSGTGTDGPKISFNGLSFDLYSSETRYIGFLPLLNVMDDDEDEDISFEKLDMLWREQVLKRVNASEEKAK